MFSGEVKSITGNSPNTFIATEENGHFGLVNCLVHFTNKPMFYGNLLVNTFILGTS